MRMLVLTTLTSAGPTLPPMDSEDGGPQLHETVDGKIRDGSGFWMIGQVPGPVPTCICMVDTSEATIDAMIASGDYGWWEVLGDA
jgi:hypothetical protein